MLDSSGLHFLFGYALLVGYKMGE
ncbi:hypothetical protein WCLP8_2030004 [uncultured Gammaproteobacteria bacterium]